MLDNAQKGPPDASSHDFRRLKALLKSQSGRLGDLLAIVEKMSMLTCFICPGLASRFLQLKPHEADITRPRSGTRKGSYWSMYAVNLGSSPSRPALANYVEGCLMPVNHLGGKRLARRYYRLSRTVKGCRRLLREAFQYARRGRLSVKLQNLSPVSP